MKRSRSALRTTIAELPVKFVEYRMFGSEVITSASSRFAARDWRRIWWRRLSAGLGAYDMDGLEPLLERRDHLGIAALRGGAVDRVLGHRRRRDRDRCGLDGRWGLEHRRRALDS